MSILLCIVLGLLMLYFYLRPNKSKGRSPPGPRGWPLVGIGLEISEAKIHEHLFEYANQYGDIFKANVFGNKLIVLNSADLVRKAFNDEPSKKHLNDRISNFVSEKVLFGGNSISTMQNPFGSDHGLLRKEFVKAMHMYGEGRNEIENKVRNELENLVNNITSHHGEEFDFMDTAKRSLTKIVAVVLGGRNIYHDDDFPLFWKYDEEINFFFSLQVDTVMQAFPLVRFIPSVYKQRSKELMDSRKAIIQKYFYNIKASHKPGIVKGLIGHLIEEQRKSLENGDTTVLTDERIQTILLETIFAGMVTTIATITSLILCLINNPQYQKRIQEELDAVIGKDRLPTFADKSKCPFIEAVTLETFRYTPIGPTLVPHLCRSNVTFEGYNIETNSLIIPNIWYIHHDEKIWGDPWTFRPERFLDTDGQLLPNDHIYRKSLIPFGTGRRQCVGESFARSRVFLFVATLLQRWTFSMDPQKKVSCDPRTDDYIVRLVCIPKHYKCKAEPRI